MKKMRVQLLLLLAVLFFNHAFAQQKRTVTGEVTDENGSGLAGVTIAVKGGSNFGVTDANGHFSVAVTSSQNVLVFSYVGFETQEVNIAAQTRVAVVLKPSIKENEAVVVTALGITKQKRSLCRQQMKSLTT